MNTFVGRARNLSKVSPRIRGSPLCAPSLPPFRPTPSIRQLSGQSEVGNIVPKATTAKPIHKPPPTPLTETIRDFLEPADLCSFLAQQGLDFYTGVPDSLLQDFCAYIDDNLPASQHIISANEGSAIAIASGYHFATGKIAVVYMQNSGFGNAANPLLSLADPQVYSIPMLLFVGWRGEPGKKDEPQHLVQGKRMAGMLSSMNINYEVLPDYIEGAKEALELAVAQIRKRSCPYVFLVKRQTFTPYQKKNGSEAPGEEYLLREEVLKILLQEAGKWDSLVCTTGFTSREVYELRVQRKDDHDRDFLTVGSMGHASAIAMGVAVGKPSRQVICVDGDGAALMHMGNLSTIGTRKIKNLKHILLNNGAHESVGGQATGAFDINWPEIAKSCGYQSASKASTEEEVRQGLKKLLKEEGPGFLEIRIRMGARANLGRPKHTPVQSKELFMDFLKR